MPNCNAFGSSTMVKFIVEYGKGREPPAADARLDGPAYHRNHEPIWSAISGFLLAQSGDVLEIGSGTGQHATEFARCAPQLNWWPSDIYDSTCKFARAAANRPLDLDGRQRQRRRAHRHALHSRAVEHLMLNRPTAAATFAISCYPKSALGSRQAAALVRS
jgi:Protein of unknown function (DUF938)